MSIQFLNPSTLFSTISSFIMNGVATPTGLKLLLQTALLLALGLLSLTITRHRRPYLQTFICHASFIGVALSMLLAFSAAGTVQPVLNVTIPTAPYRINAPSASMSSPLPATLARTAPEVLDNETSDRGAKAEPRSTPAAVAPSVPIDLVAVAYRACLVLWMVVTLALLAWLGLCHFFILRLRLTSKEVTDGAAFDMLNQLCKQHGVPQPALLAHSSVSSPLLCGLWKPAILLPATYQHDYDTAAMRAVLLHELAHWQRRDLRWNVFSRILCALLWPQPLMWALQRRMEGISEEACDQAVINGGCSPREYASVLVSLAERLSPGRVERAVGAGVVPSRSALGRRVQGILVSKHRVTGVSWRARAAVACSVIAVAVIASLAISVRAKPPSQVDLSTPEAAVKSFVAAYNKGDVEQLANCVYEPVPLQQLDGVRNHLRRYPVSIGVSDTQIKKNVGNEEVIVQVERRAPTVSSPQRTKSSMLKLRRRDGDWKLLASDLPEGSPETLQWFINAVSEPGPDAIATWVKERGTGEISGRARWEDGRSAASIQFYLVIATNYPELKNLYWHRLSRTLPPDLPRMFNQPVTTDAKGNFRVTALAGVPYSIVSSLGPAKQPTEWIMPQPQKVTPQKGTVVTKNVIISRGSLIQARVVALDTRQPIAGVEVIAYPAGGPTSAHPPFRRGITDAVGQVKLRVPSGEYLLLLNPSGAFKAPSVVSVRRQKYSVDRPEVLIDGKVDRNTVKVDREPARTVEFRLRRFVPATS